MNLCVRYENGILGPFKLTVFELTVPNLYVYREINQKCAVRSVAPLTEFEDVQGPKTLRRIRNQDYYHVIWVEIWSGYMGGGKKIEVFP